MRDTCWAVYARYIYGLFGVMHGGDFDKAGADNCHEPIVQPLCVDLEIVMD